MFAHRFSIRLSLAVGLVCIVGCAGSSSSEPAPAADGPPKTATRARPKPRLPGRGGPRVAAPGTTELELAVAAAKAGELDVAIQKSRDAIAKNPRLERAHLLLGSSCSMVGNDACEAAAYEAGLEAIPTSVALQREMGFLLLRQGQVDEGVRRLEAARNAKTPVEPELLADLAFAYKMAGRLEDARRTVDAATAAAPNCVACLLASGEVALAERDFGGAEAAFAAAVQKDPANADARRSEAKAVFLAGDTERAADLYLDLAKKAPEDLRLQVQAGQVLMKAKRNKEAVTRLQAAAELLPDEPKLLSLLADAQAAAGMTAAAKKTRAQMKALSAP